MNNILLTGLFLALNLSAGEPSSNCPEGTREEIIYNDCVPSADTFCAAWYSRIECIPEPIICTMDLNPWGHSSRCNCGENYNWNEVLGLCQLNREFPCTRDINQWGFASRCGCYPGYTYDQTTGKCRAGN